MPEAHGESQADLFRGGLLLALPKFLARGWMIPDGGRTLPADFPFRICGEVKQLRTPMPLGGCAENTTQVGMQVIRNQCGDKLGFRLSRFIVTQDQIVFEFAGRDDVGLLMLTRLAPESHGLPATAT